MMNIIKHSTHSIPLRQLDGGAGNTLHVASLVVHVRKGLLQDAINWLTDRAGVEIYTHSAEGKLAIVAESHDEHGITRLLDELHQLPAVLNAALVYHEILDGEDEST